MTTSVDLSFPWGRYHATAWDRNANEGSPDWPPAPWRLLRALYASWQWHCPSVASDVVEALLAKLATPPAYYLPPFRLAHSRHYYPEADHQEGVRTKTTKTFDSFVVTSRDAVLRITWDVDLTPDESSALDEILKSLAYLGRADSLVEARLVNESGPPTDSSELIAPGATPSAGTTRLLVPSQPLDLEKLTARPLAVRKQRRPQPEGTEWAVYPAPHPDQSASSAHAPKPSPWDIPGLAIRFSITGAPKQLYQALPLGEALHAAYLKGHGDNGNPDPMLTGTGEDGEALQLQHQHAHNFSIGRDGKDLVRSMVVWVPGQMRANSLAMVAKPHSLFSYALGNVGRSRKRSSQDVLLGVESIGTVAQVAPEIHAAEPTTSWESITPYGLTRQSRTVSEDSIAADVQKELEHRGLPAATEVRVIMPSDALRFRRRRSRRSSGPVQAFMLRIQLVEPVYGPISLGQYSHFGLGLFRPVDEDAG